MCGEDSLPVLLPGGSYHNESLPQPSRDSVRRSQQVCVYVTCLCVYLGGWFLTGVNGGILLTALFILAQKASCLLYIYRSVVLPCVNEPTFISLGLLTREH